MPNCLQRISKESLKGGRDRLKFFYLICLKKNWNHLKLKFNSKWQAMDCSRLDSSKKKFWLCLESNPSPHACQFVTLTTRPSGPKNLKTLKEPYEYIFNLIQLRVSPVGVIRRWPSGVWIWHKRMEPNPKSNWIPFPFPMLSVKSKKQIHFSWIQFRFHFIAINSACVCIYGCVWVCGCVGV